MYYNTITIETGPADNNSTLVTHTLFSKQVTVYCITLLLQYLAADMIKGLSIHNVKSNCNFK